MGKGEGGRKEKTSFTGAWLSTPRAWGLVVGKVVGGTAHVEGKKKGLERDLAGKWEKK